MDQNSGQKKDKISYKKAGVDIEKADRLVDWMKDEFREPESSHPAGSFLAGIGGFAALFKPELSQMEEPVLASSTDGIGTKLIMGLESGHIEGLSQDLVGMCVNDLLCCGAQPLFFLDYFASSSLDEGQIKTFLSTLKKACVKSGVSLIGGETAELPGLYSKGHFDAAGFAVGVVDRPKMWTAEKVQEGDAVFALASSGFHSNGYSLLRKLFGESGGEDAAELMTPTKLYWPFVKRILENKKLQSKVRVAAHITGGGLDNSLRVLPEACSLEIKDWTWPDIFNKAKELSGLSKEEMLKTFSCGMGMLFVVDPESLEDFKSLAAEVSFEVVTEGRVLASPSQEKSWSLI